MPTSNSLKGMHNLRTIQTKRKDADAYKENSDYLKLFMLEKERTRLHNERVRLLLRLETLNARMKEIEEFYTATLGIQRTAPVEEKCDGMEPESKEWKTKPINY